MGAGGGGGMCVLCGGVGGGGFSLANEDLRGGFDDSFPACAIFFLSGDQLAHTSFIC